MDIFLAAAVLPAIVLLIYVYRLDPVEKEPAGLLISLLFLGMVSTVPALILEMAGSSLMQSPLAYYGSNVALTREIIENFIVVALVEECCKYVALRWRTWRNPNFNYLFDGIVYAVFVGLGFAIAENINYVYSFGLGTAFVRAFTAIPGHCMFAIFMGYFYGHARHSAALGHPARSFAFNCLAIAVPVIWHGLYDLLASTDDALFLANLVALVVLGLIVIKGASNRAERI